MKRLPIALLIIFAASYCMGQATYAHDLIPSVTGYNLGHDSQRWNGFIQNLNISGQTILPFRGYTQCLKVGPTGLLYADRNCATTGGGGAAAPPLYSVQFNNPLGTFAGNANFTYNPDTSTLNVGGTPAFKISITPPSPLSANYAQSLSAVDGPFTYAHGSITPGDCTNWYSLTQVADAGAPCGASGLAPLITPPSLSAGQAYTVLSPTTLVNSYTGGNGTTNCNTAGSGWIDRTYASGLSDWDVYCAWGGYSLPAGISPSNVVGVYGVVVAGANQTGAPIAAAFGQGTITYNAGITFGTTTWGIGAGVGTGESTVTLATGGSATSFNYGTTNCAVDSAATTGGSMNAQTFVDACAIVVVYTGTQTYTTPSVQVVYPLDYNAALHELTIPSPLPVRIGGTGTATPALVAGSGISVTGTWPNQTITNTLSGSTATSALSGDVTMTSSNTAYDGPSVSLVTGTWLLQSTVTLYSGGSSARYTCKLWDGSTVAASTESDIGSSASISISLSAIVTPGTTTSYKVSCLNTSAGATMNAAATNNGAGNNATKINAIRLQ